MVAHRSYASPTWMAPVLIAAGWYNLIWGAWVVLAPNMLFEWTNLPIPLYPQIWQCVGMIVGVYGIGYLIAATDPIRHWPIVLVGFLGKVFGPIGFLSSALSGDFPWVWGLTIVTNDLIWWIPFAAILWNAFRENTDTARGVPARDPEDVIERFLSNRGRSIREISSLRPLLIVFVRHAGCTFCRETLNDLAQFRPTLEREGFEAAVVHMSRPMEATQLMAKYGLDDLHRFHDPQCVIYRAFGVPRGSLRQLFGGPVWWRGFQAGVLRRHGVGKLAGDGFRMAAAFVVQDGEIVKSQYTTSSADRLNFAELIRCTECDQVGESHLQLQPARERYRNATL